MALQIKARKLLEISKTIKRKFKTSSENKWAGFLPLILRVQRVFLERRRCILGKDWPDSYPLMLPSSSLRALRKV